MIEIPVKEKRVTIGARVPESLAIWFKQHKGNCGWLLEMALTEFKKKHEKQATK